MPNDEITFLLVLIGLNVILLGLALALIYLVRRWRQ